MHSAVLQSSAESLSHSEHTVQPEQLLLYKGCCARLQTYLDSLKLLECVQAHARPHVHSFVYYRGHWSSARFLQSSDLQPAFTGTLFPHWGTMFSNTHILKATSYDCSCMHFLSAAGWFSLWRQDLLQYAAHSTDGGSDLCAGTNPTPGFVVTDPQKVTSIRSDCCLLKLASSYFD